MSTETTDSELLGAIAATNARIDAVAASFLGHVATVRDVRKHLAAGMVVPSQELVQRALVVLDAHLETLKATCAALATPSPTRNLNPAPVRVEANPPRLKMDVTLTTEKTPATEPTGEVSAGADPTASTRREGVRDGPARAATAGSAVAVHAAGA